MSVEVRDYHIEALEDAVEALSSDKDRVVWQPNGFTTVERVYENLVRTLRELKGEIQHENT